MSVMGTMLAIAVALFVSILLGPAGGVVLISIIFGLVLSMHFRSQEMHSDIKRIKEKLGIKENEDFNMSDEEIEEELLKDLEQEQNQQERKKQEGNTL
ncbi:hypothetical protein [Paenibacillus ihumii]|uniref:hypothetical protein n=1 Tax=Paenibacillus ihumii TaxID=687436 RepID=UPI0006D77089|nr:hypothetical protein [Paenibacillus ihumii]